MYRFIYRQINKQNQMKDIFVEIDSHKQKQKKEHFDIFLQPHFVFIHLFTNILITQISIQKTILSIHIYKHINFTLILKRDNWYLYKSAESHN